MSEEQKQLLEQKLWGIANLLRGKISPDDYRDYILGFIFYKYLSEKQEYYANELLKGEKDIRVYAQLSTKTHKVYLEEIKRSSLEHLGYFLMPDELFSAMCERGMEDEDVQIIDELQGVLREIEQRTMGVESEDDFHGLFEDIDVHSTKLGRSSKARNEIIVKILVYLNDIDFKLDDAEADVLGDAYEYLIGKFAAGAGKSAGEFYTPQKVSQILAKLVSVGRKKIRSAYDPTCGSGSLLLRVAKELEVGDFYGQEINRTTHNLARMNMILHDVRYDRFDIARDDTLEHPHHIGKQFEAIVANPPFSAHWKGDSNTVLVEDDRFRQYGKMAPKTKADFAFLQHMIYHLTDDGVLACVLPHGVLFRGAAEGHIRTHIIKTLNYIDAIIGLPANIFYGTGIPTCIVVIKKCRKQDDNVVFIDASRYFVKEGNQNVLRDEDVERIINAYTQRKNIDKYCYVATLDEIRENEYNLNIPRYVDTFEEEESIDIEATVEQIGACQKEITKVDKELAKMCKELGIASPC